MLAKWDGGEKTQVLVQHTMFFFLTFAWLIVPGTVISAFDRKVNSKHIRFSEGFVLHSTIPVRIGDLNDRERD